MPENTPERDKAIRKAYGIATQKLREAHRDEFTTILDAEYVAAGLNVVRRDPEATARKAQERSAAREQIAEQKRQAKIQALQAQIEELSGSAAPASGVPAVAFEAATVE